MKKYLFIFFLLINQEVSAQNHLQYTVDSLAHAYLHNHTGALAIGICDNGNEKIFYYGETEKGNNQLPDSNSIFEIGNITETFTSVLFADLSIKGAVRIDDPLQNYLPANVHAPVYQQMICKPSAKNTATNPNPNMQGEILQVFFTPYACVPDSSAEPQPILLCYLSTHTSGLPDYPDNMKKNKENPFADYTKDDMYDFLKTYNAERPVGFDYKHSDLGIALLGHVLSLRMNKSFDSLLTERIFIPLNMNNTGTHLSNAQQKYFLNGHNQQGNTVPHWTYDVMAPAGGARSSISDMMKFLSANISKNKNSFSDVLDYTHNSRLKFVDKKSNEMQIALGWKISPTAIEGNNICWQNGITGGFASYIGFVETNHTGVVILSSVSKDADEIGTQIIKTLEKERLQ